MRGVVILQSVDRHHAQHSAADYNQPGLRCVSADLQVFFASKAALTLGSRSTALSDAFVLSQGWLSSSSAVGRFVGSMVRQDRTNSRAVSDTPCQYSACGSNSTALDILNTDRLELVVPVADGLHLLVLRVSVEWGVATQQEVAAHKPGSLGPQCQGSPDDSNRPDIHRLAMSRLLEDLGLIVNIRANQLARRVHVQPCIRESENELSAAIRYHDEKLTPQVVVKIENLSSSSTLDSWSSASLTLDTYPKVRQHELCILGLALEQDVLRLQVWPSDCARKLVIELTAVHDPLVVQVFGSRHDRADDRRGIPGRQPWSKLLKNLSALLKVTTSGADPVK